MTGLALLQTRKRKPYENEEDDIPVLNKRHCHPMCKQCTTKELKKVGAYCLRCQQCELCLECSVCDACFICADCHEPFQSCKLANKTEYSRGIQARYHRNVDIVKHIIAKVPDTLCLKQTLGVIKKRCKLEWKHELSIEQVVLYAELSMMLDTIENIVERYSVVTLQEALNSVCKN